jgi:hypothetical protein
VDGKLDVLRQQEKLPAAVFPDDVSVNEKTGSRNSAACAQQHSRIVEKLRFPQKP